MIVNNNNKNKNKKNKNKSMFVCVYIYYVGVRSSIVVHSSSCSSCSSCSSNNKLETGKYGKHVAISTLILFSIGMALRSLDTNE